MEKGRQNSEETDAGEDIRATTPEKDIRNGSDCIRTKISSSPTVLCALSFSARSSEFLMSLVNHGREHDCRNESGSSRPATSFSRHSLACAPHCSHARVRRSKSGPRHIDYAHTHCPLKVGTRGSVQRALTGQTSAASRPPRRHLLSLGKFARGPKQAASDDFPFALCADGHKLAVMSSYCCRSIQTERAFALYGRLRFTSCSLRKSLVTQPRDSFLFVANRVVY